MADQMRIEITAGNKGAQQSLNEVRQTMSKLEQQAVALSQRLKQATGGGSSGLVDQFGRSFQANMDGAERSAAKAGGTFATVGAAITKGLANPLEAAGSAARGVLTALGPVGLAVGLLTVVLGEAGKKILELVLHQGKLAEQTANLSDRLGISVGETKRLSAMAEIAGVDLGALEGSTRLVATALEDSTGAGAKAAKALSSLGIATRDTNGDLREGGTVTLELLEALSKVEDQNKRVMLASQVLGRSSKELMPLIKNFGELQDMVRKLKVGLDASNEATGFLSKTDDAVDQLGIKLNQLGETIARVFAPVVLKVTVAVTNLLNGMPSEPDAMTQWWNTQRQKAEDAQKKIETESARRTAELARSRFKLPANEDALKRGVEDLRKQANEQYERYTSDSSSEETIRKAQTEYLRLQRQVETTERQIKSIEERRAAAERAPEYTRSLQTAASDAQNKELTGVFKADYDHQKRLQKLQEDTQNSARNRAIEQTQWQAERQQAEEEFNKKAAEAVNKTFADQLSNQRKASDARFALEAETQVRIAEMIRDSQRQQAENLLALDQTTLEERKTREMARLESLDATTLQQKAALEQQKLQVEKGFINESLQLELRKLDLIQAKTIELLNIQKIAASTDQQRADIQRAIDAANTTHQSAVDAARQTSVEKVKTAEQKAATDTAKLVRENWDKTYDRIKESSAGVFDAMLTRSKSVWKSMADSFKNIFLTAIKEIVSSNVARTLTSIFLGGGRSSASTSGAGWLGGLAGIFAGGSRQGGGIIPGVTPGTTPPFVGGLADRQLPGLLSTGVWGTDKSGNPIQMLGNNAGLFGTKGAQALFGKSGSFGKYGGAVQSGLLMGGLLLGSDGWSRGGWTGAAELAGGGASIGMAVGGPIGAAIGAAVGGGIGIFKAIFGKSVAQQVKERVQKIYGIRVDDKTTLNAWAQAAKAAGGIDLWLKGKDGMTAVENYAMATGQKFKNAYSVSPFSLSLQNGALYEQASFTNGSSNSALTSLPGFGFSSLSSPSTTSSAGPTSVTLQLSAEATQQILQGQAVEVIQSQPRTVAKSLTNALSQNVGRFQVATAALPTAIGK